MVCMHTSQLIMRTCKPNCQTQFIFCVANKIYSICADHHQLGGTQLSEVEARETVVIQPSPCEVTANCPVHVTPRDLLCARLGTDLVPVGVHHIAGHLLGIGLMKKMDSAEGERGKRSRLVSFGYCHASVERCGGDAWACGRRAMLRRQRIRRPARDRCVWSAGRAWRRR